MALKPDMRAVGFLNAEFHTIVVSTAVHDGFDVGYHGRKVRACDDPWPARRRGHQFVGVIAVLLEVMRQEDQRVGWLRAQAVDDGRAVLDDAIGVGEVAQMTRARDGGTDQRCQRLEDIDLRRRPFAFAPAAIQGDESPPVTVGEHRNSQRQLDVSHLEQRAAGVVEIPDVGDDRLAPRELRHPRAESHVGHVRLYSLEITCG